MVFLKKVLPVANLCIGCSALAFQFTVLYPWHNELKNEFLQMRTSKSEVANEIKSVAYSKLDLMSSIEKKLDSLIEKKRV